MKVYPFGAPDAIDVTGAVDRAGHAHCGREGRTMKDTYLAKDFRATAARRFPAQAAVLNAAFDARLQALRADNAAAGKEKQFHLEKQILPGIAAYERDAAERHAEGRSSADGPRLRGAACLEAPEALPCPDARPRPAPENAGDLHEADPADVR